MGRHATCATLLAASIVLQGCEGPEVRQYSVDQFANTTRITGVSFSHDERRILLSNDRTGIFNAYSLDIASGEMVRLTDSQSTIFSLSYFPEDDRILYLGDRDGNELYHIYMQNLDGVVTDLTPADGARATFLGWSYDQASFFVGSNKRDKNYMDVYEMDARTLEEDLAYRNDEGCEVTAISRNRRLIALVKFNTWADWDMFVYDRKSGERRDLSSGEDPVMHVPLEFDQDSRKLYYLTDEGREYKYLMLVDLESGERDTIETADTDIDWVIFSRTGRYRASTLMRGAVSELRLWDQRENREIELPPLPTGYIYFVSFSRSERHLAFYANASRAPSDLYLFNIESGRLARLTNSLNPEIDRDDLVEAELVSYRSFDGLEIPAVLYKPHGAEAGDGLPALVYVHSGPGGMMLASYDPFIQYIVNRGYALIAPNYRGSYGFGKSFLKLDDRRHGRDDLEDVVRAKEYLRSTGFVDMDRVAVIGTSYGGYLALAALAFRPDEFTVGVDIFGITNWLTAIEEAPSWWTGFKEALYDEIGHPVRDRDYLESISPSYHAGKIRRPLIILQGANDVRVRRAEVDEMVETIRLNGVPVEYIVFDDEGHGFHKQENRITAFKAISSFLDKYLGSKL